MIQSVFLKPIEFTVTTHKLSVKHDQIYFWITNYLLKNSSEHFNILIIGFLNIKSSSDGETEQESKKVVSFSIISL